MPLDRWPNKDPNEVLDYDIDWAGSVNSPGRAFGDSLTSSTWMLTNVPDDGMLVMGATSFSTGATKIWLSGGTVNKQYRITNRVTTVGGRTMDKSGLLLIKEK